MANADPLDDRDDAWDADLRDVVNRIIPIASIVPHPRNYNRHSEAQKARLMASDARFGQVRSIVVQQGAPGHYLCVAGHGYLDGRREAGKAYVRADIIPASWTEAQVTGYLVADNELARLSEPDRTALAELLEEQRNAEHDIEAMGYSDDELGELLENLTQAQDSEWNEALGDLPEGEKSSFATMTFHLTNEQAARVKAAIGHARMGAPDEDETGNANENGNALAAIIDAYLATAGVDVNTFDDDDDAGDTMDGDD